MKKLLLFATAVAGFAVSAAAQDGSVKTTTVQYQVPTCTNCRTTTTTTMVYPEQKPVVVESVPQSVVMQDVEARPVVMKRTVEEKKCATCKKNGDLAIRNPLFVLKEGQISFQNVTGFFREPKRHWPRKGPNDYKMENHGWQWADTLAFGVTDRFTVSIFGGHHHSVPKTTQWKSDENGRWRHGHGERPPHIDRYDAGVGLYYHLIDTCHFDAIVGYEHAWGRVKTISGIMGEKKSEKRTNSLMAGPTITVGSNWGWFTPKMTVGYRWSGSHVRKPGKEHKSWDKEHSMHFIPGVYIQPSKYYAFDFYWDKVEKQEAQWNAGIDVYPYKNVVIGAQVNLIRPTHSPMYMMGVSLVGKIVF